jgi:hypothetical protein
MTFIPSGENFEKAIRFYKEIGFIVDSHPNHLRCLVKINVNSSFNGIRTNGYKVI